MSNLILFGAGACGGYALKHLAAQGIIPCCFADNNGELWNDYMEIPGWEKNGGQSHVPIHSPREAKRLHPDAEWVATALSRPAATEIRAEIAALGVKTKPLWTVLPVCHGVPSVDVMADLLRICSDVESNKQLVDQYDFRKRPNYELQRNPSPVSELYFPDFISRRDDEVFIDCGAAHGDTVQEFIKRWPEFNSIISFEPDSKNYNRLTWVCDPERKGRITSIRAAVADYDGYTSFTSNGDFSSHLGGDDERVRVTTLDKMLGDNVPTYIKMDIEGAELEALWGARRILKEHMPVLAICAYHTSEHLWQIPLLVKAINPDYSCFFRRYAEGAFEIVWYFVPKHRVLA